MSNYPPGMRESDIPGFNDWDTVEYRSCGSPDAIVVAMDTVGLYVDIGRAVEHLYKHQRGAKLVSQNNETYYDLAIQTLKRVSSNIQCESYEVTVEKCPWKGETDITYSDDKMFWECPLCRTEHEEDQIDPREFYEPEIDN
jgi:hypothetical protein